MPRKKAAEPCLTYQQNMEERGDGIPVSAEEPKTAVYVYDIEKNTWTSCSAENVRVEDTLAANGDELLLVGSVPAEESTQDEPAGVVNKYDPASGAGARIADLKGATENPRVTVSDGVLYVYNRDQYTLESVDLNAGEDMKGREYTLPTFIGQPESMDSVSDFVKSKANAVLVPVSGGVLFLGPAAADGSSDTYLLKSGESKLKPCGKRITEDSVLNLTAAADQDSVYVIASAMIEPEGRFFRSETINNIVEDKGQEGLNISVFVGLNYSEYSNG